MPRRLSEVLIDWRVLVVVFSSLLGSALSWATTSEFENVAVEHLAPRTTLAYDGLDVSEVDDDPSTLVAYDACETAWHALENSATPRVPAKDIVDLDPAPSRVNEHCALELRRPSESAVYGALGCCHYPNSSTQALVPRSRTQDKVCNSEHALKATRGGQKLIPWSSKVVRQADEALERGATSVKVGSRSQAEELFLGRFQGAGYRNTTGMSPTEAKNFFGQKAGTYHWDIGAKAYPHESSHLQIHTFGGDVIRIFFP
jgi:hypothetical protein